MFTKHTVMALAVAAVSVGEVSAAHFHRQYHHFDARAVEYAATETVVTVVTEVVTVTAGQEPQVPSQEAAAEVPVVTTTPVVSVVPTVPAQGGAFVQNPPQQPTTLATRTSAASSPAVELPEPTSIVSVIVPTLLPSTSAAAPSSSAAPAPAPVHGGKRGAAFNDASLVNALLTMTNKITWTYNWGASQSGLKAGIEFVPMLWGAKDTGSWAGHAKQGIANGATALLSCNEPDIAEQANMSPVEAARVHRENMNPFAGQARISSPAISSSQNPNQGLDWMKQFFQACPDCVVDFCAIHWYGPGGDAGATAFLKHVKDAHAGCQNKPIWITEFNAESGDVNQFYRTVVAALESDEYSFVERYSPFFVATGYLMQSSTSLSSWGQIFATQ